MDKSIIQIDISILDKEIESLKKELQSKTALRDYIHSLAKSTPAATTTAATNTAETKTVVTAAKAAPAKTTPAKTATTTTAPAKTSTPVKAAPKKTAPVKAATKSSPSKTAPQKAATSKPLGLTDFILDYLKKNPKSESKPVTDAFIKASGNTSPGVKFNVANTLSRLRKENKLKVMDGPKGGFLWSVK